MAIVKQSMCVLCALGFLSASSGFVSARQGGGAGAGKVTYNPFTIKKTTKRATAKRSAQSKYCLEHPINCSIPPLGNRK
jgi:hypothetical protein